MKSKLCQLAALLLATVSTCGAIDWCYYTANGPCHLSSLTVYPPGGTIDYVLTTAGQSYNWCSSIGLGAGNTGTQDDGQPFVCIWDVTTAYNDGTFKYAPGIGGSIYPCKAAGGAGC
jgi:hypothetical protein